MKQDYQDVNVKEELLKIKHVKAAIDSKKRQIEYLELQKPGLKSPVIDDMPKCGGCNIYENVDYLIDKIDGIQKDMSKDIATLCDLLDTWKIKVDTLSEEEKLVINLRYFEGRSWRTVAKDLNYDERHVYRLHGRALENLSHLTQDVSKCQLNM